MLLDCGLIQHLGGKENGRETRAYIRLQAVLLLGAAGLRTSRRVPAAAFAHVSATRRRPARFHKLRRATAPSLAMTATASRRGEMTTAMAVASGRFQVSFIPNAALAFRSLLVPEREKDAGDATGTAAEQTQPSKRPRIRRDRYTGTTSHGLAKKLLPIDPQADKTRMSRNS